jgi:CRISPR-associated protein Cmr5
MSQSTTPTLDQQRAQFALKCIRDLEERGEEKYGHYVSYVSAMPAKIVMNGLGQALTTNLAKAKGKPEHPRRLLYNHVAGWLSEQILELRVPDDELPRLLERLMDGNQDVYVRAQAEAMSYLNWLKQFARAYLQEQEGQADA